MNVTTNPPEKCAACGKDGGTLKLCTACRMVKYCNVACQKAHRPKHKNECKKRAAQLMDEELFKVTPKDDCPICFLPLPLEREMSTYKACCGKVICCGCLIGVSDTARAEQKSDVCPFCRKPKAKSNREYIERMKKRMECGDGRAFNEMGGNHRNGSCGVSLDPKKGHEMYLQAAELGCADGYHNLGNSFMGGVGADKDIKKARMYYELAAKAGCVLGRYNIGCMEEEAGNANRAIRHWMIAAMDGHKVCLDAIKDYYMDGKVSKDEYEKALRAYQKSIDDMKSDMRTNAKRLIEKISRQYSDNNSPCC